jgi:ribonuclease J
VMAKGEADVERLREALRLAARRVATKWTGKKPVVDVLIIGE